MRSTCTTIFLRKHVVTLPSRDLYIPRTTNTSSSLRIGIDRTPCLACNSFDKLADINLRRASEWALKCALRFLRRELDTVAEYFIVK